MKTTIALLLAGALAAHAADADPETTCRAHLKRIGGAIRAYRIVHDGKSPAKLADLYLDGLVESLGDFTCPASGVLIQTSAELETKSDYTFDPVPGTTNLLAREKTPHHGTNTVLAVFADGSIKSVAVAAAPPVVANSPASATKQPVIVANPTPPVRPDIPPVAVEGQIDVNATMQRAQELILARRLPEALELYRRVSRAQPDNLPAGLRRASLELAVGDMRAAQEVSQSLLKSHPESGPAHSLAGLVAHCLNDAQTARQMLARARTLDPQLPGDHYQQATAYNRQLVSGLALQHYAVAAMMEPQRYYVGHYYMGKIYETTFMPAAGIAELEAYLRYDANSQWATLARQAIQGMRTVLKDAPAPVLRAIPTSP